MKSISIALLEFVSFFGDESGMNLSDQFSN